MCVFERRLLIKIVFFPHWWKRVFLEGGLRFSVGHESSQNMEAKKREIEMMLGRKYGLLKKFMLNFRFLINFVLCLGACVLVLCQWNDRHSLWRQPSTHFSIWSIMATYLLYVCVCVCELPIRFKNLKFWTLIQTTMYNDKKNCNSFKWKVHSFVKCHCILVFF